MELVEGVGIPSDEWRIRLVNVHGRSALGLDVTGEPGVVGVPVRQHDLIDVREAEAALVKFGCKLLADPWCRDPGVDERDRSCVGQQVGVIPALELVVSERQDVHVYVHDSER